jgi:hypothetical protein
MPIFAKNCPFLPKNFLHIFQQEIDFQEKSVKFFCPVFVTVDWGLEHNYRERNHYIIYKMK